MAQFFTHTGTTIDGFYPSDVRHFDIQFTSFFTEGKFSLISTGVFYRGNYLNCNDNFDLMKENVRSLLENDTLYQEYSNNAYEYVKKQHDVKKVIKEWISLINSIS